MTTFRASCRILLDDAGWITPGDFFEADATNPIIARLVASGKLEAFEEAMPTSAAPVKEAMTKTPWIYDPEDLKDYDLDTLNATIQDNDSSIDPYETIEEAIAHLSMDHAEWQRLSSN